LTQSGCRQSKLFALRDCLFNHVVGTQQDRLRHDEITDRRNLRASFSRLM